MIIRYKKRGVAWLLMLAMIFALTSLTFSQSGQNRQGVGLLVAASPTSIINVDFHGFYNTRPGGAFTPTVTWSGIDVFGFSTPLYDGYSQTCTCCDTLSAWRRLRIRIVNNPHPEYLFFWDGGNWYSGSQESWAQISYDPRLPSIRYKMEIRPLAVSWNAPLTGAIFPNLRLQVTSWDDPGFLNPIATSAEFTLRAGGQWLNPGIDYVNETIYVPIPASLMAANPDLAFVLHSLRAGPSNATEQQIARERWSATRITEVELDAYGRGRFGYLRYVAEIDISRLIPRGNRAVNVAFMIPGYPDTRSVVTIRPRPPVQAPATATTATSVGGPSYNIRRINGPGQGILITHEDDTTTVHNNSGTNVVLQFGLDVNSVTLGVGETEVIPNNVFTMPLNFTVRRAARSWGMLDDNLGGLDFASQPVRIRLPARPRAPRINFSAAAGESGGTFTNFSPAREDRAGAPQVSINGSDWVPVPIGAGGSVVTLRQILNALAADSYSPNPTPRPTGVADPSNANLYVRIGHTSRAGASAAQTVLIPVANWNAAVS